MKPRITYPRTVVLPKDCEQLWLAVKANDPGQSFNGWVANSLRVAHPKMLHIMSVLDKQPDEA